MKLPVALSGVAVEGCAKPNCKWNRAPLHRHHKRHQALWFGPWAWRGAEKAWRQFVQRYNEYRPKDIVRLCSYHHAEIHSIYDVIILSDVARLQRSLYKYTWPQGHRLMRKLEDACDEWLKKETPGIDSEIYGSTRMLRRKLLKKAIKKKARKK